MPCPNSARERSITIGFRVTPEQARRIDLMARTSGMTAAPAGRRSSSGPPCAPTRCSATRWGACTASSGAYGPRGRSTRGSPGPSASSRGSSPPCAAGRSPPTSSARTPSSSACRGGERRAFHPLPMRGIAHVVCTAVLWKHVPGSLLPQGQRSAASARVSPKPLSLRRSGVYCLQCEKLSGF